MWSFDGLTLQAGSGLGRAWGCPRSWGCGSRVGQAGGPRGGVWSQVSSLSGLEQRAGLGQTGLWDVQSSGLWD